MLCQLGQVDEWWLFIFFFLHFFSFSYLSQFSSLELYSSSEIESMPEFNSSSKCGDRVMVVFTEQCLLLLLSHHSWSINLECFICLQMVGPFQMAKEQLGILISTELRNPRLSRYQHQFILHSSNKLTLSSLQLQRQHLTHLKQLISKRWCPLATHDVFLSLYFQS